jgi:hypothetical protein
MRSKAMRKRAEMPLRDFGTKELYKHHLVVIEGTREPHARVRDQRPLDSYHDRCLLAPGDEEANAMLYRAGSRLRQDWDWSVSEPPLVARLSGTASGGGCGDGWINVREDAKRKDSALRFVGSMSNPVLTAVVCEDQPVKAWGLANGGGKRGMGALRAALQSLCRHYRM